MLSIALFTPYSLRLGMVVGLLGSEGRPQSCICSGFDEAKIGGPRMQSRVSFSTSNFSGDQMGKVG